MKRSQQDEEVLNLILEKAEQGYERDMGEVRTAVNLRQRIYNYRKSVLSAPEQYDKAVVDRIRRVQLSVSGSTLRADILPPSYMDKLRAT